MVNVAGTIESTAYKVWHVVYEVVVVVRIKDLLL